MNNERRQNRSDNYAEAIRLQLQASVDRAQAQALVLAGSDGLPIADSGKSGLTDELAAVARRMAMADPHWSGHYNTSQGEQMLSVMPVETPVGRWYLCGAGATQTTLQNELKSSVQGVTRIMGAHFA